jgi:transposase
VVDYETYCKIHDHLGRQGLTAAQTARALGMDPRTVAYWATVVPFRPRIAAARASLLDPFKSQIVRWLDTHPYRAQQIDQRLRDAGFAGGRTIVKDYVHRVRPRPVQAFLKLEFDRGEAAQVDWALCRARHRPQNAEIQTMPRKTPWRASASSSWYSRRHCVSSA